MKTLNLEQKIKSIFAYVLFMSGLLISAIILNKESSNYFYTLIPLVVFSFLAFKTMTKDKTITKDQSF